MIQVIIIAYAKAIPLIFIYILGQKVLHMFWIKSHTHTHTLK